METDRKNSVSIPEVWAGIECTINRIGNDYHDQLVDAGCYVRDGDIDLLADAGVETLRFPVLWERHQRTENEEIHWRWTDQLMERMRARGIRPVAGLLHHGSGPVYTSLEDPLFPEKLAAYAKKVAERYPWVEMYTPVNEPLTTARFSGLYGFWYPHKTDDRAFCRMLVNQVRGIALAMQAVREINPAAKLVQTEDLARIHSTDELSYQRDFENHRRWISYDLLCGKVNAAHPLYTYLTSNGISPLELEDLVKYPCPPDIAGFNYYATSERWLDHRIENYPGHNHDGNGRDIYVDVEAVRSGHAGGVGALLTEAWQRYTIPLALTEVHLGCTREEQLRWFRDIYETCMQLSTSDGINIVAVTVWSVFGAFDWNSLLTVKNGVYEPGAFDLRSQVPRKTALASLLSKDGRNKIFSHPAVAGDGWWRNSHARDKNDRRPVLILGATGTLGNAFVRVCEHRNLACVPLTRRQVDIRKADQLEAMFRQYNPWAVINATGYVRIDAAETEIDDCIAINTEAATAIAALCARYDLPLICFSSDQVFGGDKQMPYSENDPTRPLNVYGHSKAMAEAQIAVVHPQALLIRTSAFFGPWDNYNFARCGLSQLASGAVWEMNDPGIVSPTYVPDLVNAALDLLIDGESGLWHLSNNGAISWHDFARQIAERGGYSPGKVVSALNPGFVAQRPAYSALTSEKGLMLPKLDQALEHFFTAS